MRSKIIYFIFISCLMFTSCKKKDSAQPAPSPSPATTGNPVVGGDYGVFLSAYTVNDFGNNTFLTDSAVNASFYDSPNAGNTNITAGTVSVNGITLWTTPAPINYYISGVNIKNLAWQVSGAGTITATSFSYVPSYPNYTAGNLLPDTIIKSNGFNFTLNGVSNTNKPVYISMSQVGGTAITRTISTTPATITVSPAELAGMLVNNSFAIRVSFFNYSNVTLNSKQYAINANRVYNKFSYLK